MVACNLRFREIFMSACRGLLAAARRCRHSHALALVVHHPAAGAFSCAHWHARVAAGHDGAQARSEEQQHNPELAQELHCTSSIAEKTPSALHKIRGKSPVILPSLQQSERAAITHKVFLWVTPDVGIASLPGLFLASVASFVAYVVLRPFMPCTSSSRIVLKKRHGVLVRVSRRTSIRCTS